MENVDMLYGNNGNETLSNMVPIEAGHIVATIKSFLDCNVGDEATEAILISVGCEILNVSEDRFMELL